MNIGLHRLILEVSLLSLYSSSLKIKICMSSTSSIVVVIVLVNLSESLKCIKLKQLHPSEAYFTESAIINFSTLELNK